MFGALAVAQRSEGLSRRSRVMQYRREPDVRQEIECSFTVRSAAEFGSVDARRVAGTAGRRNAPPRVDAGGVATSHLWSSAGDCAGATEGDHARCRGSPFGDG